METLFWALLLGSVVILWLALGIGLPVLAFVQRDDGKWGKTRSALIAFIGALILVFPLVYVLILPKANTLLAEGCYHVGVEAHTTYVLSGKVLVPITSYTNTFVQFVCPQ